MIKTIVTPENSNISIKIPESYIGKQIEVLLYATEELVNHEKPLHKTSEFKGKLNLTEEQYADFQYSVKDGREEWIRDI